MTRWKHAQPGLDLNKDGAEHDASSLSHDSGEVPRGWHRFGGWLRSGAGVPFGAPTEAGQCTPGTSRRRTRRRYASYSGKRSMSMDSSCRDFNSKRINRNAVAISARGDDSRDHPSATSIEPP